MAKTTIAVRVLEELRRSHRPLDDDELTHRLGVSRRQVVNQVCRRLESAGRLRRYVGTAGKIVNDLDLAVPTLAPDKVTAAATSAGEMPSQTALKGEQPDRRAALPGHPVPVTALPADEPAGRKTLIRIARLGAVATVLAAVVGSVILGIFQLVSSNTSHSTGGGASEVTSQESTAAIRDVSFDTATDIITVNGFASNLAANEQVYAVVLSGGTSLNPSSQACPPVGYYASGPAMINSDGSWTLNIQVSPTDWTVEAAEVPCIKNHSSQGPAVRWLCCQRGAALRPPP